LFISPFLKGVSFISESFSSRLLPPTTTIAESFEKLSFFPLSFLVPFFHSVPSFCTLYASISLSLILRVLCLSLEAPGPVLLLNYPFYPPPSPPSTFPHPLILRSESRFPFLSFAVLTTPTLSRALDSQLFFLMAALYGVKEVAVNWNERLRGHNHPPPSFMRQPRRSRKERELLPVNPHAPPIPRCPLFRRKTTAGCCLWRCYCPGLPPHLFKPFFFSASFHCYPGESAPRHPLCLAVRKRVTPSYHRSPALRHPPPPPPQIHATRIMIVCFFP